MIFRWQHNAVYVFYSCIRGKKTIFQPMIRIIYKILYLCKP
jgi:hypothetical protein